MTNTAILAASALLVFAYLVDSVGKRFRLPSVVLLILTGMALRHGLDGIGMHLRWVDPVVPILGTLGLILIVLEGSLDLSVDRARRRLIVVSSVAAVLGFVAALVLFALLFRFALSLEPPVAVLAAIPFAVISSAVAIPSAAGLPEAAREFVVYESSLSDIIGVLVLYAWLDAEGALGAFAGSLVGSGVLSLAGAALAAIALFYLVNKIEGHVRFLPLLAGIVLLYAIGKAAHLSPLIMVLVCGLLLNNPHLLERTTYLKRLHTPGYDQTLAEFKGLVAELTFAVKSFFFILLGYWTDTSHMAEPAAWGLAAGVVAGVYLSRYAVLALLRQPDARRLTWIAPRGLITVLLFITAAATGRLDAFPFGTVMLVVLATATLTALAHLRPADARSDAGSRPYPPDEPALRHRTAAPAPTSRAP
jgi:Kef-type K+ transport system membrane component KefB